MDSSLIPKLKRCTQKIVNRASRPGGLLEKGEFTMGVARRLITEEMDLKEGSLDTKEWKGIVKEEVNKVLDALDGEGDGSETPDVKPKTGNASTSKIKGGSERGSGADRKPIKEEDPESTIIDPGSGTGEGDGGNESDMSSVYDIAPAPKRRKKDEGSTSSKAEKAKKEKRPKKDVDEGVNQLSPEEAKVAELKRIVVACGVRKQWSKEFADCPKPSSQIRHLHSLLSDLGMKGTPTIGKAKSLKEKRELAAELDEVREFEAKRGMGEERRASRSRDQGRQSLPSHSDGGDDEDNDDDDKGGHVIKEKSALDSVLDFLGDQSD